MTPLEEIKNKVQELGQRYKVASAKKANFAGLLQAKREALTTLTQEIQAAGLDPKNLKGTRDALQAELEAAIKLFDEQLAEVEKAFEEFEKK